MAQDIHRRIDEMVYRSRHKRWYHRWWGKLLIVAGVVGVLYAIAFVFVLVFFYQKINSGELMHRAVSNVKQDAINDLLLNGNDPSIGPKTAPVVIVAFEDFQCPYCLAAQPFIKRLLTAHAGDVRFIYKDFPLTTIHPSAQSAAEAAQCAFEQGKFWEMHDKLFENHDNLNEATYRSLVRQIPGMNITQFNDCYASGKYKKQIADDVGIGTSLGVVGTPTFFVNGVKIQEGFDVQHENVTRDNFEKAIEFIKKL